MTSGRKYALLVALAVVLVMSAALPAAAEYTKLYQFKNTTGLAEPSARVILNGLESITAQYAIPVNWVPASVGTTVLTGVYCTTVTFTGYAVPAGNNAQIGWTTADNSCRLRDLRWGDGIAIVPTQLGGVPGGGIVFYNYPNPGDLTVVVTNDNPDPGQWLSFSGVEFGVSGTALNLSNLSQLAGAGLTKVRVADIDQDISVLRADVVYHRRLGDIPYSAAASLICTLDKAVALKEAGLCAYREGALRLARYLWTGAAQQIQSFVCQVTSLRQRGKLSQSLYNRWIGGGTQTAIAPQSAEGGGQITTAPQIQTALLALPQGQALQSLDPFVPTDSNPLPPVPSPDPETPMVFQPWPVEVLNPGEYTAFVVHNVPPGASFIMRGSVVGGSSGSALAAAATGTVELNWIEQSVADTTADVTLTPPDTQAPVIDEAGIAPNPLQVGAGEPPIAFNDMVSMTLTVSVSDNSGEADWYVAGVESNQPESGLYEGDTAPDWTVDPNDPHALQLRAEPWITSYPSDSDVGVGRIYTITLKATDKAGNVSEPYTLTVPALFAPIDLPPID